MTRPLPVERHYVIAIEVDDHPEEAGYIYLDKDCGYLPGACCRLSDAAFFTLEEAETQLLKMKAEKPQSWSDAMVAPPASIYGALNLCNARPIASGAFTIKRIILDTVTRWDIKGRLGKLEQPTVLHDKPATGAPTLQWARVTTRADSAAANGRRGHVYHYTDRTGGTSMVVFTNADAAALWLSTQ